MEKIPIFVDELEEGASLEKTIEHLVSWFNENVPKKDWSDEQIDKIFGRRSAHQIMEDGHVFYMNPCLPYSLVAYEILRQNGYKPTLVLQVLEEPDKDYNPVHFGLEFLYQRKKCFIDFSTKNRVFFGEGEYRNCNGKGATILGEYKIPGDFDVEIGPKKNIFGILEGTGLINGFELKPVLKKFKDDRKINTFDTFVGEKGVMLRAIPYKS